MNRPVLFVAFQEQDNLGVGYLASVIRDAGHAISIIDFRMGRRFVLDKIREHDPLVVGFSVIFQYHISEFRSLMQFLRDNGITCHFCAGGHYPSLRYEELLDYIPQLDSVVLFEGEYTFRELVQALTSGNDWQGILGVAYRRDGSTVASPLRPLEPDLDNFPTPARPPLRNFAFGKKYATLLAGRGCVHNCSYCSIRQFYSRPPGKIKRLRRPEMVAREMELLHQQMDATVFMFQDDDFPVAGKIGHDWTQEFCRHLRMKGLADKISFKINCRPDEVDENLFALMRSHGLFLVYLGIESGTDEGLRLMNKRATVRDNLTAVNTLKRLGIDADYGFMLFDPSSTYESVRRNVAFLGEISCNGFMPINFCKMLPYAGTLVEQELAAAGRLKGRAGWVDYDFLDESLNRMFAFVTDSFYTWIMGHEGLLNTQRWARYRLAIYRKYFPTQSEFDRLYEETRRIIDEGNRFILDTLGRACDIFEAGNSSDDDAGRLAHLRLQIDDVHLSHLKRFQAVLTGIENLAADNQSRSVVAAGTTE